MAEHPAPIPQPDIALAARLFDSLDANTKDSAGFTRASYGDGEQFAHCLAENIASFCRRQSVQPVTVERTSQLTTVQELVALDHGVSIVPEMARRLDLSRQRVYRSFSGEKPLRTVAMMWNPSRYQGRAAKALMQHLRLQARG